MTSASSSQPMRLNDLIMPRRPAAKRADASFLAQLESSPIENPDFGEPMRKNKGSGKVKVRYGGRVGSSRKSASANASKPPSPPPVTAPPARSLPRRAAGSKRRRSESFSSESDQEPEDDNLSSSLTPLSSPSKSISTPRRSMRTPVKKLSASVLKQHETAASISAHSHRTMKTPVTPRHAISSPALGFSGKSLLTPLSSLSAFGSPDKYGKWSFRRLSMFVWVLVDMKGNVIEDEYEDGDNDAPQRMWWPALNKRENSLRLYGSVIPGTTSKLVNVQNPSERNIRDAAGECFTVSTFLIPPSRLQDNDVPVTASPKKKQKTDIETRWRSAVDDMNEDKKENDDEDVAFFKTTPSESEGIKGKSKPKSKAGQGKKGKSKARTGDEDTDILGDDDARDVFWVPPTADESLNIGEEKVFAHEKKNPSMYWPAMVLYYKQPKSPKEVPLYGVRFLDEIRAEIPRSWFFTSDQDEFATCKLGIWKSSIIEVGKDDDDMSEDKEESSRGPSPEPTFPPPNSSDFVTLSIHEQLAYVKPVLGAIINDAYKPAQGRHLDFIKGGTARTKTQESAASRGRMSPDDVGTLQECMMRWVLREQRRGKGNLYKDLEENGGGQETEVGQEQIPDIKSFGSPLSSPPLEVPHDSPSSTAEMPPSSFSATRDPAEDDRSTLSHQIQVSVPVQPKGTSQLRQQVGCEGYEGLAPQEKIGYCLNVLLPEAIRQILLWREGKRTSYELLSDAEEEALYKVGEEMLQKTDWVYDTMRMRESRLRVLMKGITPETIGGTRSRPKKRSIRHC